MVAIITINYNLSSETIPCVNSLLDSLYQNYVIYLIDNGSKFDDYNILMNTYRNNAKVKLLRIDTNCGYVGGVNFGLETALKNNSDYFLIMNNDTIIDKGAVGYLVDCALKNNNEAIVTGKVYYHSHPNILQHTGVVFKNQKYMTTIYPGRNEHDIGQFDKDIVRDSLDDVFWLIPNKIINDIGLYSEYFFLYAEQGDYAQRARRKGYKLIFTPNAKLWHKESMTTGKGNPKALSVYYWRGQGQFVFQFRNLKLQYFIISVTRNIIKLIYHIFFGGKELRSQSIALFRGYFWGIRWMFKRNKNTGRNPYLN